MDQPNITLPQFLALAKRCEPTYFGVRGGTCVFCKRTHNILLSTEDVELAKANPVFWTCEYSDCGNYNRMTKSFLSTPPHDYPNYGVLSSVVKLGEEILHKELEAVNGCVLGQKQEEVVLA